MITCKYYMGLCTAFLVSGAVCFCVPAHAEVAQGDGDPYEVLPKEEPVGTTLKLDQNGKKIEQKSALGEIQRLENKGSSDGALRLDEQGETADNAVATVTADGDFLLPTYLLPGETATVTRKTVVEEVVEEPSVKTIQERTTVVRGAEQNIEDTAPLKVDLLQEMKKAETAKPIHKEEVVAALKTTPKPRNIGRGHRLLVQKQKPQKRQRLLLPLAPITEQEESDPVLTPRVRSVAPSVYADQILDSYERGEALAFLMPRDLKISFYPHESSFSGQSLKWIKAFAVTAVHDPRLIIEIRASRMDGELQRKRLLLIVNALRGAGLSTHQILIVYTDRSVDTMLLRAVPRPEKREIMRSHGESVLPKNVSKVTKW